VVPDHEIVKCDFNWKSRIKSEIYWKLKNESDLELIDEKKE
jgi:hypothetical protein